VVTGVGAGGGTRTVAHWVATALSRAGRKVVLLRADDQDAREAGGPPGLAEALSGQVPLDELPLRTLDGGPWLLHAGQGPTDPGELLAAPGMTDVMQQLGHRFDHVVVEAPPVLPYVETALLAAACADQVVLVVRPGWSARRKVRAAVDVLAQQEAPVTLSVLTRFLRAGAAAPEVEALPPLVAQLGEVAAGRAPVVVPPPPADADTAAEADPVPQLDPGLGSGLGAPAAQEPDPDADPKPEPEPEPEPAAEAGSATQAAGEPEPDDEPDAGPDEASDEASGEASDVDLDAELEAELEADLRADLDAEPRDDADDRVMSGGRPARGGDA
jgi:hypothetical protein